MRYFRDRYYFKDKVSIVTGGASGIGRALVKALAEKGAKVVIADINYEAADDLATELCALGYSAKAVGVDVTNRKSINRVIQRVVERYGRLDLMVNNAGIVVISELEDTLEEDWNNLIDVNLRGVVYGTELALKQMKLQGFGQILNTASSSGLSPTPMFAAYSSIKHAVVGLSTATRIEAASSGVKVNVLCPGVVDTPIIKNNTSHNLRRELLDKGTPFMMSPERVAKAALKGLVKNRAVIPVGLDSLIPYWANRYMPEWYSYILQKSMWLVRRRYRSV